MLAKLPPPRALSDDERRTIAAMLDAASSRSARLLVMLVEHDGLPIERAADVIGLAARRARELIGSLRVISLTQSRHAGHAEQLRELFGLNAVEPRKITQKGKWKRSRVPRA